MVKKIKIKNKLWFGKNISKTQKTFVTLDKKTSLKCQCYEIEIYTYKSLYIKI